MRKLYTNMDGSAGAMFILLIIIVSTAMFIIFLSPVADEIRDTIESSDTETSPVSQEARDSTSALLGILYYSPVVILFTAGLWYLAVSKRESGGQI